MELIYQKIVETFNNNMQVFTDRNLPAVRMVDIYMGQPDDPESFELLLPGVFVDWNITPGEEKNTDIMLIDFHVVQEPGTGTENFSDRLPEGLEYLRMLSAVKFLVNKLSAENTSPLIYAGERPRTTPFYKYHIVSYRCLIDNNEESLHRSQTTDVLLDGYELTDRDISQKQKVKFEPSPIIEVFK